MFHAVVVFLVGLVAGAMNAAAGGGSFLSVPALIYLGIPSVAANMSSTIALYPGSLTSAWAYRGNLQAVLGVPLKALFLATLTGGFAGALLLLFTPNSSFDKIIAWLLLLGGIAFAFGPTIGEILQRKFQPKAAFLLLGQFFLGIYGGYFGGAVGIMMMAVWSVLGYQDIKSMNAVKVVLVAAANTVAVLCFATFGPVAWRETLVMMAAAAAGGYLGARIALRLKPRTIRISMSVFNLLISVLFFYKTYA
jgi:uncharacterized membrane protein YfcA